jgi:hypothetical protein
VRPNKQLAQNLETVLLAARMSIAQDSVGLNDFFEQHQNELW